MLPLDLIDSADILVNSGRGKPTQVSLRRATSAAYYAVFHCLAKSCADLLVGGPGANRSKPAWQQTYRALEHGIAKRACASAKIDEFPGEIRNFANTFASLQQKRHSADYDPFVKLTKSEVLADIKAAKEVIENFPNASIKDRRAFAAYVLFKPR